MGYNAWLLSFSSIKGMPIRLRAGYSSAILLLSLTLVVGCSGAGKRLELSDGQLIEAVLTAAPTHGMHPLDVTFVVQLKGGPEDCEELYCLDYEWVFDREGRHSQTPKCGEYEPGKPVQRVYTTAYRFDAIGTYQIRFRAKGGLIRSNAVTVTVRYNPFRDPDDTSPPRIKQ